MCIAPIQFSIISYVQACLTPTLGLRAFRGPESCGALYLSMYMQDVFSDKNDSLVCVCAFLFFNMYSLKILQYIVNTRKR